MIAFVSLGKRYRICKVMRCLKLAFRTRFAGMRHCLTSFSLPENVATTGPPDMEIQCRMQDTTRLCASAESSSRQGNSIHHSPSRKRIWNKPKLRFRTQYNRFSQGSSIPIRAVVKPRHCNRSSTSTVHLSDRFTEPANIVATLGNKSTQTNQ